MRSNSHVLTIIMVGESARIPPPVPQIRIMRGIGYKLIG